MAGLNLFHVNKIYDGGVHAVKDFCLDIKDKEFVVFVGPSGCGKSTTLRMIAGLEKISSGDLYIGDRLVNALPAKERNIAMVFQSYALFPNMTVYDNISFGLRMHGEDKAVIEQKVNEVAEMLNLTEYLKRKPSQLSGGQKQRVALGRAIVRNPDVFLLDEPLSNLDAKLRAKMRHELLSLHRRLGATFIYVTHDQTEAMTMGDKIVVMKDGEVMQIGSPALLYRYPSNKFVASFIGTPQMNFWEGEISLDGGIKVTCAEGIFPLDGELGVRLDDEAKVDGKKVIVGIRPEDVYPERKKDSDVEIKLTIDVAEELCTHTVLHGKVGEEEVVAYGKSGTEASDEETTLYADIDKLHLFDKETERALLPHYSTQLTVKATKNGDKLRVLGGNVNLSSQQATGVDDGDVEVKVPIDAFIDGDIPLGCKRTFSTDEGDISLVRAGGTDIYAKGDWRDKTSFSLDASKLTVIGSNTLEAMSDVSRLTFVFAKRKEKQDGKNVVNHYCSFGKDAEVQSYYEFNKKMYRLGKGIFHKVYAMYISRNNVRLARENECYPTIEALVQDVEDYSNKQYSRVRVSDSYYIYVDGALPVGETVRLALDLDNVHVGEENSQTILF